MSTTRLPELPVPHWCMPERMAGEWKVPGAWSSDQMHAYGLAVWKDALEQAAQAVTVAGGGPWTNPRNPAAVIRALPLPEQGSPQ